MHPSIAWFEIVSLNVILVHVFWCKSGGKLDKSEFFGRCERSPGWCWVWITRLLPADSQTLWVCVYKYKRSPFSFSLWLGAAGLGGTGDAGLGWPHPGYVFGYRSALMPSSPPRSLTAHGSVLWNVPYSHFSIHSLKIQYLPSLAIIKFIFPAPNPCFERWALQGAGQSLEQQDLIVGWTGILKMCH